MRLPGKLGNLLGKNQGGASSSFMLEAAVSSKAPPKETIFNTGQIQHALNSAKEAITAPKPSESVLDLDFLAEPLDELGNGDIDQDSIETLLPLVKDSKTEASTPAPELKSAEAEAFKDMAGSTDRDRALAESLRLDKDYGCAMFDQEGKVLEITDNLLNMVDIPISTRSELGSYRDLLKIMAKKSYMGDKNVEALLNKEAANMPRMAAKKEYNIFKWKTPLKSGKTLEFKNKYTPSGHLITVVSDVTSSVERDRVLRLGLELGTSGYWSYHFSSKKSVWGGYLVELMRAKQIKFTQSDDIRTLVHPSDTRRVMNAFADAVKSGERLEIKFRVNTNEKDETHLRLVGQADRSPITGKAETFIAYISDITEEKRRVKELEETKELSQNRSNFLSRMSHEIKTPLNAIVGMTEALRDEVDNAEARETAKYISDAAESLNIILSQTLEHERLATTQITLDEQVVNLEDMTRSVVAMWKKPCADKGIDLKLRLSPQLPDQIILDPSRLRQCLTNLLSNAVKFTASGSILLVVGMSKPESGSAQLVFGVRDSGIGMSEEAAQKIFKPFQQADPSIRARFGGSGLGMTITQHIVSAMMGQIKVKSTEGEGTTVAISIPLKTPNQITATAPDQPQVKPVEQTAKTAPQASEKPVIPSPKPGPSAGVTKALETFHKPAEADTASSANIIKHKEIHPSDYSGFDLLIVEDNPINQAVVRKLLVNHIKSMTFAFHGQEALEILEKRPFDVILMDIHMPVKDGIETTLEIRNSGKPWADTTIIALTADPDFQQKRVCRNIGMNDALSKPVRRQDLLDAMQKVLDRRKLDAQVA